MTDHSPTELLGRLGARIRRRRLELELGIKELAKRSDMSARFLSDVELGRGNIAIGRLEKLAAALEVPMTTLVRLPLASDTREAIDELLDSCPEDKLVHVRKLLEMALGKQTPNVIALLGVRGAGKSAVGVRLARQLALPFVELVDKIEASAGMSISDIFTLYGESYYRQVELRCLAELVASNLACVAALPGGVVSNSDAFDIIKGGSISVWLKARPEDYWNRVFAQGDTRPMAGQKDARAQLKRLVRERQPLYQQASCIVETSGVAIDDVVAGVHAELDGLRSKS